MTTTAVSIVLGVTAASTPAKAQAPAATQTPNIVVIMGDDIGWFNIGAYNQGIMYSTTPNLDKLASEGMRFTDYYAEPSCTAGRANFITGELPIRTGLTTVGQAGATVGMPDEAPTIATALKSMGYETGQFGKNHLGDLNQLSADRPWLRRVLRLPLSPGCDGGSVLALLPAGAEGHGRPAQHGPQLGHRRRRSDGAAALGQDRQAEDRGRGPLPPHPMPGIKYNMETVDEAILDTRPQVHRQGQEGRQAVLRLDEPDPRCTSSRICREKYAGDAQRRERLVPSKKPAWRSSMTSSAG